MTTSRANPTSAGRVPAGTAELRVVRLAAADHRGFLAAHPGPGVSFLQLPEWAAVKPEWRAESVGWVDAAGRVVGAALVLHRRLARIPRSLAYLPEGPVLDWAAAVDGPGGAGRFLDPLAGYLRRNGSFAVRIGPPVVRRRWAAATVKSALAGGRYRVLGDVPADEHDDVGERLGGQLRAAGWRPAAGGAAGGGFAPGQPRFVFWLPLIGRGEADVLAGLNQLWRRNIRKAERAGVVVTEGTAADLPAFHACYVETAGRDHFTPRPLGYFQTMFAALNAGEGSGADGRRVRLYLAHHDGELAAAAIGVRVGGHHWYSYGASATAKRDTRASNAVQWRMIRDALAAGARVYDLRGITDTLDPADPHRGLVQFKVGTGGVAVEYVGEWDLPLSRLLYAAFDRYLRWRR